MQGRVFGFLEAIIVAVIFLIAPVGLALQGPADAAGPGAGMQTPADLAARVASAANIDATNIENQKPGQWLSYGRTYSEHRFSPLTAINTTNVKTLGVAWQMRTYTVRGLEATPIVNDGIMYVTGSWSKVWALDAATGTLKLTAQFDNDDSSLFPNQFVNIKLLVEAHHRVLRVPSSAIQSSGPGSYVYLIKHDNTVAIQPIIVSTIDGDMAQVEFGLDAGDQVVVDGADQLRDGAKVIISARHGDAVPVGSATVAR